MEHQEHVIKKPDYEKLYHHLFNEMTDIIDKLQHVQQKAEDLYILQSGVMVIPDYITLAKTNDK